jgi:hypothetical protein
MPVWHRRRLNSHCGEKSGQSRRIWGRLKNLFQHRAQATPSLTAKVKGPFLCSRSDSSPRKPTLALKRHAGLDAFVYKSKLREVDMQRKSIKPSSLIWMVILCIGMTVSSLHAENVQNSSQDIQNHQNRRPLIVAGSPEVCLSNYNQCMRGCDGMQSCSNQCQRNYQGCLH